MNKHFTSEEPSLRQFIFSLLCVVLVIFIGAIGFYVIEAPDSAHTTSGVINPDSPSPQNIIDAFYFAIETITTTGYGDIRAITTAGRLWVTCFSMIGLFTMAWAGANALAFVVAGHLNVAVRERKMEKSISKLKDHYIICCLGRVGLEIVRQFRDNTIDYVVIDKDREILDQHLNSNELRLVGDSSHEEILEQCAIHSAKGLISCVPSDAENVFTILTAKGMNPDLFVIARGENESSRKKMIQAGADRVVLPSLIGGMRMATMAIRPAIVDFLDQTMFFSKTSEPLLVEDISLATGCQFIGQMLKESHIKSLTEVLIMGVRSADETITLNPPSSYTFKEGDVLIGLGQHAQLEALRQFTS